MNINEMEWPLSKEELEYLYWGKEMSMSEIGTNFKKVSSSIYYYIKKYKIKTRKGFSQKTHKNFEKEVYDLVKNEYSVLEKYKNSKTKIKMKHNKCGNVYKIRPSHFLDGRRCPICSSKTRNKKNTKTTKEFKQRVFKKVGNEYEVLGKYIKNDIKIKMKHNKCGNVYMVTPSNFIDCGNRCPKCAKNGITSGEEKIMNYFKSKGIKHKWQHRYKKCRNKKTLPFDFKIKNKPIVIEYNGRQHYEPIEYYGGNKQLKYRKKLDKIKKDFCKEKNIKLIIIPYWEKDNIEEILEEELKEVI